MSATIDHLVLGAGSTLGGDAPLISDIVRHGDVLYLSGRAPVDPATLAVAFADDFAGQAGLVLDDVARALALGGCDTSHVLRVECYLARADDFPTWNRLFAERFPAPRPARTTLLAGFPVPGILVEVQVTAGAPA